MGRGTPASSRSLSWLKLSPSSSQSIDNYVSCNSLTPDASNISQPKSLTKSVSKLKQKSTQKRSGSIIPRYTNQHSSPPTAHAISSSRRMPSSTNSAPPDSQIELNSKTGTGPRSRSRSRSRSTSRSRSKKSALKKDILPANLKLFKRNLTTAFVGRSKEKSNLWITNIQASDSSGSPKSLIYSFQTEEEAKENAYANSPPKMAPFEENPLCFLCGSKFNGLRRRPASCRNCGVCICKSCTVSWDKSMVPETFNPKNTNTVNVCKTCDYLATEFRGALLDGKYKHALKVYMTGNVNLRCPFANVTPGIEIMYPVHCAASSGNLELIRWLIDVHKCPIQTFSTQLRTSSSMTSSVITTLEDDINSRMAHLLNKNHNNNEKHGLGSQLIKTSHGRTILDVALEQNDFNLLRYLVNEKKISLSSQISGHNQDAAFKALEMFLRSNGTPNHDNINNRQEQVRSSRHFSKSSSDIDNDRCNIINKKNRKRCDFNRRAKSQDGYAKYTGRCDEKNFDCLKYDDEDNDIQYLDKRSRKRSVSADPYLSQNSSSYGSSQENTTTKIFTKRGRSRSRSRNLIDKISMNRSRSRSENSMSSMSSRRRKWTRMKAKKKSKKEEKKHDKENLPRLKDRHYSSDYESRPSSRIRERDQIIQNDPNPLLCNASFPFFDDSCF